ncbi:tolloid-like protein 2 isoform X2 [Acropora millepora]|uniref:tolloid-like protein 2 isoform X2 n=1 Tax=Acropora millepora TaxID=45264 RepID=UPI001CF2C0F5|nr:tolloid-like protein 2 isoform X2 [Acropora millepora]
MLITFLAFFLVECVLTQCCPGLHHFGNRSGTIRSTLPGGPFLYANDLNCEWNITISHTASHVQLSFSFFDVENCRKCSCDFVEVFDVVGPKKYLLGKFCGSVKPGPFYSSKQTLLVVFKSDHGNGHRGFTASYQSVLPGFVCRKPTQIFNSVGSIASPDFHNRRHYPDNMDCVWNITTPPRTRIKLKLLAMSIQRCGRIGTGNACSCDFLEIRDGNRSDDRLLATLCGNELVGDLFSSGRHLWVRFRSDENVTSSGFYAMFSSSPIVKGHSCPETWRYPIKCPQDSKANSNQTDACCYDNGPSCCQPGGRRCTDKGANKRDYCPRPNDDGKLKYCCEQNGKPSCCASSGVCLNFRVILLVGVLVHFCYQVKTLYS